MTNLNSTRKDIRKFGGIAFLLFGVLCAFSVWRQHVIMTCFFGFLCALGLCFLAMPERFKPVYNGWMKVAHLIGTIFTMLILTLAYYLVITPAALAKRIFGGRPLPLKPDFSTDSYWVERKEHAQPKERFYLRY